MIDLVSVALLPFLLAIAGVLPAAGLLAEGGAPGVYRRFILDGIGQATGG